MDGGAVDAVIGKGLNIAVISALPAVDITTVHVVLDGRLSHTVLFSVVQKGLTEPHSLCYSIHGEWCCTIKVDIENSKGQYIEKDKQEATKDGSESTKIQHGI